MTLAVFFACIFGWLASTILSLLIIDIKLTLQTLAAPTRKDYAQCAQASSFNLRWLKPSLKFRFNRQSVFTTFQTSLQ